MWGDLEDSIEQRLYSFISFVKQPKGLPFFLGTWTGRLILINTLVFIFMGIESNNFLMPTNEVLLKYGAKDPVNLALGEYYRFVTPMFVHIGLLHFAFNTWALYVFAYQLEYLLGKSYYLTLYLVAGIFGNIASSVFSTAISAGASGALFGLLGCGFVVEWLIRKQVERSTGRKPRAGGYTTMVIGNLVLGMLIPQIDNAAHVGGLVAGMIMTVAYFTAAQNPLVVANRKISKAVFAMLGILACVGMGIGSSPVYLKKRLQDGVKEKTAPAEQFYYLDELIRLDPSDAPARAQRIKLLIIAGYQNDALPDIKAMAHPAGREALNDVVRDLQDAGYRDEAIWLTAEISQLQGA